MESGLRGGALKLLSRGEAKLREFLASASDSFSVGLALQELADGVAADVERVRVASEGQVSLDTVQPPVLRGSAPQGA